MKCYDVVRFRAVVTVVHQKCTGNDSAAEEKCCRGEGWSFDLFQLACQNNYTSSELAVHADT